MPRFPKSEAEIISLANAMITGLKAHLDDFPNPPVKPEEIERKLSVFLVAKDGNIAKHALATEASILKNNTQEELTIDLRHIIQFAERLKNKEKWPLIGWSAQTESTPLQAPGQARNLVAIGRGDDWLSFTWDVPAEGGKPAVYHLQSRELTDPNWSLTATAFITEITLNNITRGITFEYRIEAANKQGLGAVSNSIAIVL